MDEYEYCCNPHIFDFVFNGRQKSKKQWINHSYGVALRPRLALKRIIFNYHIKIGIVRVPYFDVQHRESE
jgi:hypothetical protein